MADLLTIDEARALVLATVTRRDSDERPIADALGRALAEDVAAERDVPSFANSAMDGFAGRGGAAGGGGGVGGGGPAGPPGRELRIVGESRAGTPSDVPVGDGEAVRISTGAAVPDGADAILPVEDADDRGDVVVPRVDVASGAAVREPGEDLRAGEVV